MQIDIEEFNVKQEINTLDNFLDEGAEPKSESDHDHFEVSFNLLSNLFVLYVGKRCLLSLRCIYVPLEISYYNIIVVMFYHLFSYHILCRICGGEI